MIGQESGADEGLATGTPGAAPPGASGAANGQELAELADEQHTLLQVSASQPRSDVAQLDGSVVSSRAHSPWHALEIHSSEEGSSHGHYIGNGLKAAEALAAESAAAAASAAVPGLQPAADPTERLLPAHPATGPSAAALTTTAAAALPGGITPRERLYMVTLFSLVAALLYADQNLMAPNLTAIAEDFGFNEHERDKMLGGVIAAAFYIVGAPAALLFGWLSDRVNRKRLMFAAVVLGEGPCMLTIFVQNFWQLFTLRLLTGIALGGALPVLFSLLGDLYDPSRRASISSIVQLSTGVGLAAGQGIAGFVGPAAGWRWPFVIVSVPAVLVSFVMLFTCQEPLRGGSEAALREQFQEHSLFVYNEQLTWRKLGRLLLIPTNVLVIMQGLFGCLPWGMILTYLNDYLSQNKGLSVQTATLVLLVLGIGGALGVMGGGWLGQVLYNKRKWSMSVFIGGCTVLGTLPLYYLINADVKAVPPLTVVMAVLAGALSGTVGPNMRAMMLNVNEPETRGIALALQTMLDDLGKGLGPVFVAFFIGRLGRTGAFNLSAAGWIPCGLLLLGTAFTLARDEHAMQHRLRKVLSSYTFSSSSTLDQLDTARGHQQQQQQQQQQQVVVHPASSEGDEGHDAGAGGGGSSSSSRGGSAPANGFHTRPYGQQQQRGEEQPVQGEAGTSHAGAVMKLGPLP